MPSSRVQWNAHEGHRDTSEERRRLASGVPRRAASAVAAATEKESPGLCVIHRAMAHITSSTTLSTFPHGWGGPEPEANLCVPVLRILYSVLCTEFETNSAQRRSRQKLGGVSNFFSTFYLFLFFERQRNQTAGRRPQEVPTSPVLASH